MNMMMQEAIEAEKRIRPFIRETPLEYSRYLSKLTRCRVYLKLENVQRTGSFKFRGVANYMLTLTPGDTERGIITASTGNHAAAVAEMLEIIGLKAVIYLPENASEGKIAALRTYEPRVQLKFVGQDCEMTEKTAKAEADKNRQLFISPYNHRNIIFGHSSLAIELIQQIKERPEAVFVPVGGGGLMSGIALYLKAFDKTINCIGCQPEQSPVMAESIKAGRIVEWEPRPTLSDATAGGIEKDSITFDICRDFVKEFVLVSEEEIAQSIRLMLEHHFMLIEGAAALSVASFLKTRERYRDKIVILIITGKKITLDKVKVIIGKENP
ncbi:MAG TPA: threonine/serine dehydratase [Candidatus Kapabacteria bacterium]|nr:threonine/serine dehydratase [Candidatus Kapabacteria bacterium]